MTEHPDQVLERAEGRPAAVAPSDPALALKAHPREGDVVGEILVELGDGDQPFDAVAPVADLLDAEDTAVRRSAAFALHFCFDTYPEANTDVANDLASVLADDDYVVRKHAATALLDIAIEYPQAAVASVDTLPKLFEPTSLDLLSPGLDLVAIVTETDPDAAVPLLEPLLTTLDQVLHLDIDPIAKISPESEITDGALNQQERYRREVQRQRDHLADVISRILVTRPTAMDSVRDALLRVLDRDGSGEVRATLVETLGHVAEADPKTVAPTIDTLAGLLNDQDLWVAATAARTLGVLGDVYGKRVSDATAGRVDSLTALLEAEMPDARVASVVLLAYVGEYRPDATARATDALLARLDDDNPQIRAGAALALGYMDVKNAISDLRKRADSDPDEIVRMTADAVVERITD